MAREELEAPLMAEAKEEFAPRRWLRQITMQDLSVIILGPAVQLPYCCTYAAIICHGEEMKEFLPVVLQQVLLSQAVGAIMSCVSQIASCPNVDPLIGVFFGTLAQQSASRILKAGGSHTLAGAHAFLVITFATFCYGVVAYIVGRVRCAFVLRFLPYTVSAGYLASMGLVYVQSGLQLASGVAHWTELFAAPTQDAWLQAICTALFAGQLRFLREYNPLLTPVATIWPALLFAGLNATTHWPPDTWSLEGVVAVPWYRPWEVQWEGIKGFMPEEMFVSEIGVTLTNFLMIIMISWTFSLVMCSKIALPRSPTTPFDEDMELRALGCVNLSSAVFGGSTVCHSLGLPLLMRKVGGRLAWPAILGIVDIVLFFWPPTQMLGHVPKFIFGGIVFRLGLDIIYDWIVESRDRIAPVEWYLLVTTAVITSQNFGFGLVLGTALALVFFAVEYSGVAGVRRRGTLVECCSNVMRAPAEARLIKTLGRECEIVWLTGYLFFGSMVQVVDQLRVAASQGAKFIVIDLAYVPAVDANGIQAIIELANEFMAAEEPVLISLCGAARRLGLAFENAKKKNDASADTLVLLHDVDVALEWAENLIIASAAASGPVVADTAFAAQMDDDAAIREMWLRLLGRERLQRRDGRDEVLNLLCVATSRRRLDVGEWLFQQGDYAEAIWVIEAGHVDFMRELGSETGANVRLPRHHLNEAKGDSYTFEGARTERFLRGRAGCVMGAVEFAAAELDEGEAPRWRGYSSSGVGATAGTVVCRIDCSLLCAAEERSDALSALVRRWLSSELSAAALWRELCARGLFLGNNMASVESLPASPGPYGAADGRSPTFSPSLQRQCSASSAMALPRNVSFSS